MLETVIMFLNSNFVIGLATIVTGLAAWLIYRAQKKSEKVQAARVLLTEIRIAERRIQHIRDQITNGDSGDFPPVFPTKSWKKYSHLFISDFDQDELEELNAFYDYGELIEELARKHNDFFWVTTEERARITVRKLADFAVESSTLMTNNIPPTHQDIAVRRDRLNAALDATNVPYIPKKTVNTIQILLAKMPTITTSSGGGKLKSLAKV